MQAAADRSRTRVFLRRHGVTLGLALVALVAAFGLSHGSGDATAADWEEAAAQGGWSTATPLSVPVAPRREPGSTLAALPEVYRHIRPASAAGPAHIPAAEVWPAQ